LTPAPCSALALPGSLTDEASAARLFDSFTFRMTPQGARLIGYHASGMALFPAEPAAPTNVHDPAKPGVGAEPEPAAPSADST